MAEEVANHDGNVWTHIISLRREDAARLGYDNAYAWRNLLRSQAETIAENMKIPLTDLRWYAAYHDESYHPHVHMVPGLRSHLSPTNRKRQSLLALLV